MDGKGAVVFKIYMPVFFLIPPYPHSQGPGNIRIMMEGGFIF